MTRSPKEAPDPIATAILTHPRVQKAWEAIIEGAQKLAAETKAEAPS